MTCFMVLKQRYREGTSKILEADFSDIGDTLCFGNVEHEKRSTPSCCLTEWVQILKTEGGEGFGNTEGRLNIWFWMC